MRKKDKQRVKEQFNGNIVVFLKNKIGIIEIDRHVWTYLEFISAAAHEWL